MIKNYFKSAGRLLLKYKGHSIINIIGLAVGMASCILITVYVTHELNYDRFYTNSDKIHRVTMSLTVNGVMETNSAIDYPVATLLRKFPEVKEVARLINFSQFMTGQIPSIRYGDKIFNEEHFYFGDSTLFKIFSFSFLLGNPHTALAKPNTVVITRGMAEKYFGNEMPLGKILRFNNNIEMEVTGVLDKFPGPTHINFDFIASMSTISQTNLPLPGIDFTQSWVINWFYTYLLLENSNNAPALEKKLEAFAMEIYPELRRENHIKLYIQPVKDIHLYTNFDIDLTPSSDIRYIYIFSITGVLILFIACINFVNLTMAQFNQRVRDLGVRKVLGAQRMQLMLQLFSESVLLTFAAGLAAWFFTEISSNLFYNLTGIIIPLSEIWLYILVSIPFLCLLAGIYPAFVFSSPGTAGAFKNLSYSLIKGVRLRKVLVVFQFAVSIALIISTLIIQQQLDFMHNKDTGFDRHQMMMIPIRSSSFEKQFDAFKSRLMQNSNIINVSGVNGKIGQGLGYNPFQIEGFTKSQFLSVLRVDYDFIKTFKLRIVEGRDFSKERPADAKEAFIINEAAMRQFGWKESVGKSIKLTTAVNEPMGTVIGVVKDFHFSSLHKEILPLVIYPGTFGYIAAKVNKDNLDENIKYIKNIWEQFDKEKEFTYLFLNEMLDQNYKIEDTVGKLASYFSALAIIIACLGLLGLASFTTSLRTKEIGIRKVLGASIQGIVYLLTRDFIKLILAACFIAIPIAYFLMNDWLYNFAYRVKPELWVFFTASFTALLIAEITICYHAIRAANSNPVKSLKNE